MANKRTPRARKPPKPRLTRARVVTAALALVDRHGLERLTMRRLGTALSVEAMSLYRYFPSKAALEAGIADRILGEIDFPAGTRGWRDDLLSTGRSFWRALTAHPNAVPLFLSTPSDTAGSRAAAEIVLRLVGRGGHDPAAAHRIFRILQAFVLGAAMMLRASPPPAELRRQVAGLTPAADFPLLRAALGGSASIDREADFELGLGMLLDAIEAGHQRVNPGRRRR